MLTRFTHRRRGGDEFAEMECVVQQISRAELPDAAARAALIAAVRAGDIIGVYVPAGYQDRHINEIGRLPSDVDSRTTLAQWCAWWRAGKDPTAEQLAEQRTQQLRAWLAATPGPVKSFETRCCEQLDELERTEELPPRVVAHLRAEMERSAPDVTAYACHMPGIGVCIYDGALVRYCTAQEYDAYLVALAAIRREADGLAAHGGGDGR